MARCGMKVEAPTAAMRQLWAAARHHRARSRSRSRTATRRSRTGRASARATSRSRRKSMKIDGDAGRQVHHEEAVVRRLPDAVQGHRQGRSRAASPTCAAPTTRRSSGFGANLLNDDLELVTACHDACNRYGIDAVSSSATLGVGVRGGRARASSRRPTSTASTCAGATARARSRSRSRWAPARAAARGSATASSARAEHVGKGSERVRGARPRRRARVSRHALHLADGRDVHRRSDAGPAHRRLGVVERDVRRRRSRCPGAVDEKETGTSSGRAPRARARRRRTSRNAHQAMNGLGLCMFTMLTGGAAVARADQRARPAGTSTDAELLSAAASGSRTCAPRSTAARASRPATSSRTRACSARATATSTPARCAASACRCRAAATTTTPRCSGTRTTGHLARSARASSASTELLDGLPRRMSCAMRHLRSAARASRRHDPRPDPRAASARAGTTSTSTLALPAGTTLAALVERRRRARASAARRRSSASPHLRHTLMLNGERCPVDENLDARARRRRRALPARAARRRLGPRLLPRAARAIAQEQREPRSPPRASPASRRAARRASRPRAGAPWRAGSRA